MTATGSCMARLASGEFKGMKCIEDAKETRHGLNLCRRHAKVYDRWTKFGFDYVRSIVSMEWRRVVETGEESSRHRPQRRDASGGSVSAERPAAYLYVHEAICAGCKKPWTAGHVCPTPPRPWWKR